MGYRRETPETAIDLRFGYVPPPYGEWWGQVRELLAPAVERGGNDWVEVESALASGHAQLWLTLADGPINATVTRMDGDTVEIWLCGGSVLKGALPFLETILEAAKDAGATRARIIGRKGWARALAPYGWRTEADEIVKDWA